MHEFLLGIYLVWPGGLEKFLGCHPEHGPGSFPSISNYIEKIKDTGKLYDGTKVFGPTISDPEGLLNFDNSEFVIRRFVREKSGE